MVKIAKKLRKSERKRLQRRVEEAKMRGGVSASLFLDWEMNALTDADCFFFYGSRLRPKGVLSVFFPDEEHAEFTVAQLAEGTDILPELFFRALEECNRVGITQVHTVVDPKFGFSLGEMRGLDFFHDWSEYMLQAAVGSLTDKQNRLPEEISFVKKEGEDEAFCYALLKDETVLADCLIYHVPGATQVYLYGLKTGEAYRRQGFATKLIREIAKDSEVQGKTAICLQVSSENREAERLYRKLGFETEEERKYYRTKEC